MAKVSLPVVIAATALLVVLGMNGCDSFVIFLELACPYVNPKQYCPEMPIPACNSNTTCSNGGTCCPIGCGGAACIARDALCPQVTNRTTKCSDKDKELSCSVSSACGPESSCCSNACGGSNCLKQGKRGKCPAITTTPKFCPLELIASPGACGSDTNCSGDLKCCKVVCRSDECTKPE